MSQTEVNHNKVLTDQYSHKKILALWALATLPMVLLAWGVAPILVPRLKLPAAAVYLLLMILGMLWQLALSLWIIRREQGDLRWETIRRRVWLNTPLHPKTGQPRPRLYFWLLPCLLLSFMSLILAILLISFIMMLVSFLRLPEILVLLRGVSYANMTEFAAPAFSGQWWALGLVLVAWMLSAFFAEEFFFRGVLLPKMDGAFGKRDWLVNAILYSLYYLYKPWMILFRLFSALAIAWPARRFRSNWMAAVVHGMEGVGLVAIVLVGILSPSPASLQTPLAFPHIARQPAVWVYSWNRVKTSLPTYDPDSDNRWQMDLRNSDLSLFDLRNSSKDLLYADFDSQTTWPPADRMPADYDPQQIMEMGRNPGLGLRQLHTQGITGQGVGIAIIDYPLLTEHQEYTGQLKWYEEINVGTEDLAQMHGPAVAAIAVGKTVGVAPQADLYYIAHGDNLMQGLFQGHYLAMGIRRVLEINRQLPDNQKIRVISISAGWGPSASGYSEVQSAAGEARAAGMLVISSNVTEVHGFKFHGLGRSPLADPDVFESYELGAWWAYRFSRDGPFSDRLLVPMDARTTASPSGASDYVFYRQGGWSWSIPYIAGMYALAAQVDPSITPDRFWSLALETGRIIELEHEGKTYPFGPILDPSALIAALQVKHTP